MSTFDLKSLEAIIAERAANADPSSSWTAKLMSKGMAKAAQKLGEEATETVIAAVTRDREGLMEESADLLYHWLVVLHLAGVSVDDVMARLEERTGTSGIAEKAARDG